MAKGPSIRTFRPASALLVVVVSAPSLSDIVLVLNRDSMLAQQRLLMAL